MSRSKDLYYGDDSTDDLLGDDAPTIDPLVDGRSDRPLNLHKPEEHRELRPRTFEEDFGAALDAELAVVEREELFLDTLIELEDMSSEDF